MLEFEGFPIQTAIRISPISVQKKRDTNPIINIEDSTTVSIINPEDSSASIFGYSHCYWSFDGFTEVQDGHIVSDLKHPNGSKYCDQKKIFDHFGKEMVQNTWFGFNSGLISIGERGSGKSFTLFGNSANKGFVQQFGTELFKTLKDKEKTGGASPLIEVKMTMMEIYENKVKDLLAGSNTKFKNVVKIREHPKRGFYVEGLRSLIVTSGEDIQQRIEEGQTCRAISSFTNLTGSSATLIVGLSLVQKYRNAKGDEVTMSSLIDFFDLPVSGGINEDLQVPQSKYRQNSFVMSHNNTSPIGRLTMPSSTSKGDKSPDQHLTTLVSALATNSSVSYANSTVTKLLERTLSGNSKTFVIAHCIPHETSYNISLGTLSFADKIQRLRTHPQVNEEMTQKLTRELKGENDNLKKMLGNGDFQKNEFFAWTDKLEFLENEKNSSDEFKRQMMEDIKSQVKDNEREIKILNQSQEDKIKLAKLDKPNDNSQIVKKLEADKKYKPFIYNLNPDSQLAGKLVHLISSGQTDFGSGKGSKDGNFIYLSGPGFHEIHGTFSNNGKDNKTTIKPGGADCLVKVNGQQVLFESQLNHNDRLLLGGQFWLFQNPKEPWTESKSRVTFQFAQEEVALKSQFYTQLSQNASVPPNLTSQIIQLSPLVEDANSICDDIHYEFRVVQDIHKLLKKCSEEDFEDYDQANIDTREIVIQQTVLKENMSFILTHSEFLEKYETIKTLYMQSPLEDGIVNAAIGNMNVSSNNSSLLFNSNQEVIIGYGLISLKPMLYLIEFLEQVSILDYLSLKPKGSIKVEVTPCNEYFEKEAQQPFLTSSSELIAKPLHFTFRIGSAEALSGCYKDVTCQYKFYSEPKATSGKLDATKLSYTSSTSEFKYERRFSIQNVSPKLIESLENDLVVLTFYGKQRAKKMRNQFKSEYNNPSTEDLTKSPYLGLIQKQKADLIVSKKLEARIQQKLNTLQSLVELSDNLSQKMIPLEYIRKICNAKDSEVVSESLAGFKDEFTPLPDVEPPRKLTNYQKVSEICLIM